MTREKKPPKPNWGSYTGWVALGITCGLSCVPAAPIGLFIFLAEIVHGWYSDPLTKAVNIILGLLLTVWGLFGGYYIGIRCAKRARKIRLAIKAAGTLK